MRDITGDVVHKLIWLTLIQFIVRRHTDIMLTLHWERGVQEAVDIHAVNLVDAVQANIDVAVEILGIVDLVLNEDLTVAEGQDVILLILADQEDHVDRLAEDQKADHQEDLDQEELVEEQAEERQEEVLDAFHHDIPLEDHLEVV